MFEHLEQPRKPLPWNPLALLLAVGVAVVLVGGILAASAYVLRILGLNQPEEPVQVWYEPLGDGRRLEDIEQAPPPEPEEAPAEAPSP